MGTPRATLTEKTLVRVETALGLRAAVAGFAHLAVFLVLRFLIPFPGKIPVLLDIGGGGIVFALFGRLVLAYLQKRFYPAPSWRARWKVLFRIVSSELALSWSLVNIGAIRGYGLTLPFFAASVIILGTAAISVQAFGLDLFLVEFFLALILWPTVVTLLTTSVPGNVALAFIFVVAWIYLAFLATNSFRLLLEALENRELVLAQKDQLTAVLDAIPGYVFWTDAQGKYLGLNRKLLDAYQTPLGSLVGNPAGSALPDDPLTSELHSFLSSMDTERLSETPFRLRAGTRSGLVAMKKYQGTAGAQTVVIVLDIEDRKRAQQELERTREQAYESARLAALGVMAGGIAHEINNPLQVIRGIAALLARKSMNVPEAAKKIDVTVDRIGRIIAGLRGFSRADSDYPIEKVDLAEVVNEVVELARLGQPQHKVLIDVTPKEGHFFIEARRAEIGQVLINLLNNAADAVAGTPNPWIRIQIGDRADRVEIRVQDSGLGIPKDVADKIMMPFFTTKEVGKGTGLGLSISKTIAERHHGTLELDPSAPHTTFVLVLPKTPEADS